MKLIILSEGRENKEEADLINFFFDNGLDYYHLRKKNFSIKEICNLLDNISKQYHSKIIVHSHHYLAIKYKLFGIHISKRERKSKLAEWIKLNYFKLRYPKLNISTSYSQLTYFEDTKSAYDYIFLSPIFDNVSATEYNTHFNIKLIERLLQKTKEKIIALGGVNALNIDMIENLHFYGAAFSSAIWQSDSPRETFLEIKKKVSEKTTTRKESEKLISH